jgi:hypothetical protein
MHPEIQSVYDWVMEPWLRGIIPGLDPVVEHLLRASEQIREDVAAALSPLNTEQLWVTPGGMTPVGFHVKHLAGSTDRLCTYLEGCQLDDRQLQILKSESNPGESVPELLTGVDQALARYEGLVRALDPVRFGEIREVGRQRLQTTAISLAIHIAEHGQRHAGQATSAARLARVQ